jgi:hypothetical protein
MSPNRGVDLVLKKGNIELSCIEKVLFSLFSEVNYTPAEVAGVPATIEWSPFVIIC